MIIGAENLLEENPDGDYDGGYAGGVADAIIFPARAKLVLAMLNEADDLTPEFQGYVAGLARGLAA